MEKLKFQGAEGSLFLKLLIGCVFGAVAVLPYALALRTDGPELGIPLVFASFLNAVILYPLPIYLGILAKRASPLAGAPILEHGRAVEWRSLLVYGLMLGFVSGLLVIVGDKVFGLLGVDLSHLDQKRPGPMASFLAGFYGGIVEEVLLRFFLMGVLVTFLKRFQEIGVWVAIIGAALIFGIGHLPAMSLVLGLESVAELSVLMVLRVLVLNGIVGGLCGWLYWRKGIEHAFLAHFSADMVLHVISPLLLK